MSENLIYINSKEEFVNKVLNSKIPVLVDFWAPWCGPCRMIAPIFEELSNEFSGKINFAKVNTDENSDLAYEYGIMSIPTLILFKEGKVVDKIIGALPKEDLKSFLDKYI
ncbi:MAG: thioredoxin [Caldisericia bacterium]|jgi:thioredoxin 1|nr:thioredoxin [Caldisericia bacterium]MDD3428123.1 thioredoxin [Caldisericia bacterium]MDD5688729.1 thioredoxin [Caldisericia bacterium]HOJ15720.1 thioredoxin [Caldisericia bacterium]HOW02601.1 thioredoxin [Caldisericia bacterium]